MTSILITGGTGSFGQAFAAHALTTSPRRVIIYSRDEYKQSQMAQDPRFAGRKEMRYFIGDVRDRDRLARAFDGVDLVVHAAAMKQVPAAESNPFEAVKTNVYGAQNVIDAAIDKGILKVVAMSTDKAASPTNIYGATKLCSDKLFVSGNVYSGASGTSLSVVRYGNVVGSRGSVVPLFLRQKAEGVLTVTDRRMTRFWITLDQGVAFVADCLATARGGEIFVPKLPSMKIVDLAAAIAPEAEIREIGIRPGEKIHETMVTVDDARATEERADRYIIRPHGPGTCPDGFEYSSDGNTSWLTRDQILSMISPMVGSASPMTT